VLQVRVIGKFCQIAAGGEFVMNGANHQMNAASTFPFHILEQWEAEAPALDQLPVKGDTLVGGVGVAAPGAHRRRASHLDRVGGPRSLGWPQLIASAKRTHLGIGRSS
jgi:hypothetical protein